MPRLFLGIILIVVLGISQVNAGEIFHYSFDNSSISGNTLLNDLDPNTFSGSITNARQVTSGRFGDGLAMKDGSNEFVTIADTDAVPWVGTNDFSISLWMNPSKINERQHWFSHWESGSNGIVISLHENNRLRFFAGNERPVDRPWRVDVQSSTSLTTNRWYHVVALREGNSFELYLDGVLSSSQTDSVSLDNYAADLMIGELDRSSKPFFADGTMDELRAWDRALSGSEIQTLTAGQPLVPEPATWLGLLVGIVMVAGRKWLGRD